MMQQLIMTLALGVVGLLAWGLARLLRCRPAQPALPHTSRSGKRALLATGIVCLATFLLIPAFAPVMDRYQNFDDVGIADLAFISLVKLPVLAIFLATPAAFMFTGKESLGTAAAGRHNLWKSAVVGVVVSALCCGALAWKNLGKLEIRYALLLVPNLQTALGEEFFFRGYLQTRLMAWWGNLRGWLAASAIMILAHLPTLLVVRGFDSAGAAAWCVGQLPVSLLMGWLLWRTRNIAAPVLLHTFANWVNVLR